MTQKAQRKTRRRARYLPLAAAMTAAVLLTGCASSRNNSVGTHSPSNSLTYAKPGSSAAMRAVSSWGGKYEKDSKDRATILGYANALQQNEQIEQSMAVLRAAVISDVGARCKLCHISDEDATSSRCVAGLGDHGVAVGRGRRAVPDEIVPRGVLRGRAAGRRHHARPRRHLPSLHGLPGL